MKKKNFMLAGLLSLIALLFTIQTAFAHEGVNVGDYEIEIGWVNEPPIAGQMNALVVNVSDTSSGTAQPVEDVSELTVTLSYGGQSKLLTLQPLGEDTPGQFVAPLIPTIAGEYTVKLGGKLGTTAVEAETHPEEVQTADTLQFPVVSAEASTNTGATSWLTWLAFLAGLIGIGLGVTALRKSK